MGVVFLKNGSSYNQEIELITQHISDLENETQSLKHSINSKNEIERNQKKAVINDMESHIQILIIEKKNLEKRKSKFFDEMLSIIIDNKEELSNLKPIEKSKFGSFKNPYPPIRDFLDVKDNKQIKEFLLEFLRYAKFKNINIDFKFIKLSKLLFGIVETFFVPEYISNFIINYLKNSKSEKIFNPWSNGSLIFPLLNQFEKHEFWGMTKTSFEEQILNLMSDYLGFEWDNVHLYNNKQNFDLIVGFPEYGQPVELTFFNGIKIKDNLENIELLYSLKNLNENGIAVILMHPSFILRRDKKSVFSNLEKFGIYIDSIIEIPKIETIFGSGEAIISGWDYLLVILKRKKSPNLFVAELSKNNKANNVIIENLNARKNGKIPQLGFVTTIDDFYSLKALIAKKDYLQISKNVGMNSIPIKTVFKELRVSIKKWDVSSVIYLPFSSYENATINFEDIYDENKYYLQLELNSEIVSLEYFENYLNSEIGRKFRESFKDYELKNFEYPIFHDEISKEEIESAEMNIKNKLMESETYLPDLTTQLDSIIVNDMISEVYSQLNDYKHDLWMYPKKTSEVKKSIELLKIGDKFEYWLDSLPFPLSSILFSCAADNNIEHKIKYIIHFFEALSEFNVTLMLSAISKDKIICENEFSRCIHDSKYPEWYYRPTFGNWNFLGNCLAKKIRILSENKKEEILSLFGNPKISFLEMITNKKLYQILNEAADYRNQWLGHGPPVNENENKKRLKILGSLLKKTQQIISHNFEESLLIQTVPASMSYSGGICTNNVKLLNGRLPFNEIKIETISPLDDQMIYLIHKNQHEAIELLPFFRIMESPKTEQNACYFYNRVDNKNKKSVRLISYHFDKESIVPGPYADFQSLFTLFQYKKR